MTSIVTRDESSIYGYDKETKAQLLQWKSLDEPRLKKVWMNRMTNVKFMLITFFEDRGIIHHKFVELWTTRYTLYYKTVLQKVKKVVKQERFRSPLVFPPWESSFAPFSHCLTVPHKKSSDGHTLSSILSGPASMWFFLFPQFRRTMKGKQFQTTEEIRLPIERELRKITLVDFQHCNTQ